MSNYINILSNITSGIAGAIIGAAVAIYSTRKQTIFQEESELRKLLVLQQLRIRQQGTVEALKTPNNEYPLIYESYANLKCLYGSIKRKSISKAWLQHKGDSEDYIPIFTHQKLESQQMALVQLHIHQTGKK